jgi:hypothetical protein
MIVPRRCLAALLVLAVAAAPGRPAWAQSRDPAMATELFNAGRDLMKSGDYAAACPKLATSLTLDAKVGTMARLAECEEQIGQLVNARAHWAQALNLARTEGDARLGRVESEFRRLDGLVPKIDVELGTPAPRGASLTVDQVDLGPASFGLPIPVEPGPHTVTVTADGKQAWTQVVRVSRAGAVTRVDVPPLSDAPLLPTAAADVVAATAATSPSRPAPATRALPIAAVATGGAGIVALGVGVAFGVVAKSKLDDSNHDGCVGDTCSQPGFGERNDARTAGDVSTTLFIVGGALAAAGVTLWALSPRAQHTVTVTGGPTSVLLRGSF